MGSTIILFWREVLKWINRRHVLIINVVTPIFWITLFGKSFNIINLLNAIGANLNPSVAETMRAAMIQAIERIFGTADYFTYVATGMLAVLALTQSMASAVTIVFDRRIGYLTRLQVAPIPRFSVFFSRVLGTVFRISVLSLALLAIAYGLGAQFKPGLTPLDVAAAWGVVALLSLGLSAVFSGLAFNIYNQETLFAIANLLNLPLMFASSALFPREQMPTWLQDVASVNPLSHAADLVRFFLIGKTLHDPLLDFTYLTVITAVLLAVGYALALRGLRAA